MNVDASYYVVSYYLHFFWILDHCVMWPICVRFERRYCCSLYLVRKRPSSGYYLLCCFVLNMVFFSRLRNTVQTLGYFWTVKIEVGEKIFISTFQLLLSRFSYRTYVPILEGLFLAQACYFHTSMPFCHA